MPAAGLAEPEKSLAGVLPLLCVALSAPERHPQRRQPTVNLSWGEWTTAYTGGWRMEEILTMRDMATLTRRLAKGMLAAVLTALWAILIVNLSPHAEVICAAAPQLAVPLGAAFAGVAFLIGSDL